MGLSRMHQHASPPQQEQPFATDEEQQPSSVTGGNAMLVPDTGSFGDLNTWIRFHIHYIVIFSIVAFLILRRLRIWYLDYSSRSQISNSTPQTIINDGIAVARAKQMMAAKEAQKRDAELREQRRLEDIAEKERKMKELQEQAANTGTLGGSASTTMNNNNIPAFSERLPTLPSGRNYRPSDYWGGGSSSSGGGGGNYRPTGFSRPSARRG